MKRHVIDADNQQIIETFEATDEDKVFDRYQNDGRWEDVSIDRDGDIILWETIE